jgi:hypothetical protein
VVTSADLETTPNGRLVSYCGSKARGSDADVGEVGDGVEECQMAGRARILWRRAARAQVEGPCRIDCIPVKRGQTELVRSGVALTSALRSASVSLAQLTDAWCRPGRATR